MFQSSVNSLSAQRKLFSPALISVFTELHVFSHFCIFVLDVPYKNISRCTVLWMSDYVIYDGIASWRGDYIYLFTYLLQAAIFISLQSSRFEELFDAGHVQISSNDNCFQLINTCKYIAIQQDIKSVDLTWTDAPADWNGLARFAERRNPVSARVPSHFKRREGSVFPILRAVCGSFVCQHTFLLWESYGR